MVGLLKKLSSNYKNSIYFSGLLDFVALGVLQCLQCTTAITFLIEKDQALTPKNNL
jgi:hypothetical protein